MTRTFDAPRHLVVKAMATPELINRWLDGVRVTVLSAEVDLRVGGKYRYVLRSRQGADLAFGGGYCEISGEHIVQTEAFRPRRSTPSSPACDRPLLLLIGRSTARS